MNLFTPLPAAVAQDLPSVPQSVPSTTCNPSSFKVALDIDHYLAKPGAISAIEVTEFTYNLSLAQSALARLRQAGFSGAFLIGEGGTPLRLTERTKTAKEAGADLFISLHHDSVQPQYLSQWEVNGQLKQYSDKFHGYSLFISEKNIRSKESRELAVLLGQALVAEGLEPSLHHAENIPGENRLLLDQRLGLYRYDDLVVLKTAPMPAVLLESAIIVNRAEERQIRDGNYHQLVVAALVDAVRDFCRLHSVSR
jgi:N-acetylmuramoyl-L-alanine amidase